MALSLVCFCPFPHGKETYHISLSSITNLVSSIQIYEDWIQVDSKNQKLSTYQVILFYFVHQARAMAAISK
jgi:hypothetical protein